ncbi:MAG: glycosyltransferase family 9 protein [Chlamydiota bacterium]
MNMKNLIIKWLISFVKLWQKPSDTPSFLIVSTTGLGDSLWGTPALRALKEAHPHSYIGVLTSPIGAQVFKNNPHLNELFTLKNSSFLSFFSLYYKLKKKRFGTIFIFHTSQRFVLPFCFLLGAKKIVGTEGINKGLDFILTHPLKKEQTHEIARRLNIVNVPADKPFLEIFLTSEDKEIAREFLEKNSIPSYLPMIGLHPGAKDQFKQWPAEHFITLGKRLVDTVGCQIFVTGSSDERALVERIAKEIPGAIPLAGELPIRPFAALLHKLHLFITNDTGPMHIAYAMNTPTVALFCPTSPKLCGPYLAPRVTVISKPPSCTPCLRKKCRDPFCLLQIGPDQVFKEALLKLGKTQ